MVKDPKVNKKFVYRNDTVKNFEKNIEDESIRLGNKHTNETFKPEYITQCPRRIIYRALGYDADQQSSFLVIKQKEHNQHKWIDFFRRCQNIQITHNNVEVCDWVYNLVGTIDFIIRFNHKLYAIELCSVTDNELCEIKEKGARRKDVVSFMSKLWMLGKSDGILIYESFNGEIHVVGITAQPNILQAVTDKCNKLLSYKLNGEIPSRPYKTKTGTECSCCEYKKICWN